MPQLDKASGKWTDAYIAANAKNYRKETESNSGSNHFMYFVKTQLVRRAGVSWLRSRLAAFTIESLLLVSFWERGPLQLRLLLWCRRALLSFPAACERGRAHQVGQYDV